MTSSILISVAVALVTTGAASLWAAFVACGMESLTEVETAAPRDLRTW